MVEESRHCLCVRCRRSGVMMMLQGGCLLLFPVINLHFTPEPCSLAWQTPTSLLESKPVLVTYVRHFMLH
jgi:hypothetical protein